MEVMVVNPVITRWHIEDIIGWYYHNRGRNESYLDRGPWVTESGSPKPIPSVMAVPVSSIKIETNGTWNHVDIVWPTGHYHKLRRCTKWKGRWNTNADANLHICHSCNREETDTQ